MKERKSTSERLKRIMIERNLKQIDILEMSYPFQQSLNISMSKSHLSQYVNGKSSPDQHKLYLLSKTLDVNEAWLLGYDVEKDRGFSVEKTIKETYRKRDDFGFGEREGTIFKDRRNDLGMSVKELSKKINKSESFIRQYEKNGISKMKINVIQDLWITLNISPNYFWGVFDHFESFDDFKKNKEITSTIDEIIKLLPYEKNQIILDVAEKALYEHTTSSKNIK